MHFCRKRKKRKKEIDFFGALNIRPYRNKFIIIYYNFNLQILVTRKLFLNKRTVKLDQASEWMTKNMEITQSDTQHEDLVILFTRISIFTGHDSELGFHSTIKSFTDDSF